MPERRRREHEREGVRHVRVKHSLRKGPYLLSLVFLLAATSLTLLHINVADIVRVTIRDPGPTGFESKYGLYERCTRPLAVPAILERASAPLLTAREVPIVELAPRKAWQCERFPSRSECAQFGEQNCILWSSAGYMAQLSLVPCLFALVSLLFIFLHRGRRTARARARRKQWKLVSGAMLVHFLLLLTSIGLILFVYHGDFRFARGTKLGRSFWFGAAAALVSGMTFAFLTFTGLAARRGEPWAAGRSARQARRHKRTRSGHVVPVPEGTYIPPEQAVTVAEVVASSEVDETSALLAGDSGRAAGGGKTRATDVV